jgi:hypothetical protein
MTQKEADEIIAQHKGWLKQPLARRSKAEGKARFENVSFCGLSFKGAAMGLARVTHRLPGSVVLLGTPAEESAVPNAGGKIHMIRAGHFDNLDAAITGVDDLNEDAV